jgi:hypothetical protein
MSSEKVDTVKKQLEADIVLSLFFEAITEADLKDIAFSDDESRDKSNDKSNDNDNGKSNDKSNDNDKSKDTITARTSPSSASNSVSKKRQEIGENWIMVLYNPEESFDFAKILDNNGKRFKYAVWQYVDLEGTLSLQAYIEGTSTMTIVWRKGQLCNTQVQS